MEVDRVDALVAGELERTGQPGLTLGVTDHDGTLFVRTYGFAEVASRRPVTPETLFEIGSIGKAFTALAVLQLRDEGRVELDAPVSRYLPWFEVAAPPEWPAITVHHLLCHTAGIVAGIDGTPEATFQVWSLRELRPGSPPGERIHYSNVGYKALGLVIEAVEGRRYPDVIRARVLEPFGMSASEPEITNAIRPQLAVGYEYAHDDRPPSPGDALAPATWLETATADGSIASTADDMCAFARFVMSDDPRAREMALPHARVADDATYGYALSVRDVGGRRIVGHGGGMVGYLAALQTDPEAGLGVVVLQNGPCAGPVGIARRVLALVRDGEEPTFEREPPTEPTEPAPEGSPSPTVRALEGRYRSHNPWTTNFVIELRGREPWLVFPAAPDGFDDEQPLVERADGSYGVGRDPANPEHLRFDTVLDGQARRAWLSGWPYYRVS